ncbi:MAG: shikimate kinase [Clostridia bacterium]|nr:shikimate kinase [Clostridia bacterium]
MFARHIFIIGMPGSGKSSLGRRVAGNLHVRYVDMDQMIQDILGLSVSDIFAQYGQEAFRRAETNLLVYLSGEKPCLISTGGGCILREENRRIMKANGLVLLVDRPLEDIKGDIKLDRRPLLAEKGLGEVDRLYAERIDIYRREADLRLDNSLGYYAGVTNMEKIIRMQFNLWEHR